jgi:hypothetical protein
MVLEGTGSLARAVLSNDESSEYDGLEATGE